MNQHEAEDLATHAAQTWRGPNAYEWQQEIAVLDHQRTVEAFQRMRGVSDTHADLPSFRGHYAATAPDTVTVTTCDICHQPVNDTTRWRHTGCAPDPNILAAIRNARAQLHRSNST